MTFEYVAEHLIPGKDRDRLLFIAGQIAVFDDLIGSFGVDNQKQAKDYDPNKPQGICVTIYAETDPEPDTGHYFTVFSNGTVEVMELMSFPCFKDGEIDASQPREICREDSATTLEKLLLWLRSQPPSISTIL
jgi:hypothetical protein